MRGWLREVIARLFARRSLPEPEQPWRSPEEVAAEVVQMRSVHDQVLADSRDATRRVRYEVEVRRRASH